MAWLIDLIMKIIDRLIKAAVILFTSSIFFVISVSMLALLLFICLAVIYAINCL
ncbi:MAG: hypothetical protein JXJ17_17440 [Anaerolineae bacterium]|nr:hypothetical protein [Anaerolineae bacterium]